MFPWNASGRAIAGGRDEGVTKLLFDDSPEAYGYGYIMGGGMFGNHAGDMIGEIAFARAWCDDCGHDYFVAYSCKGHGVCPSCNTGAWRRQRRT